MINIEQYAKRGEAVMGCGVSYLTGMEVLFGKCLRAAEEQSTQAYQLNIIDSFDSGLTLNSVQCNTVIIAPYFNPVFQ